MYKFYNFIIFYLTRFDNFKLPNLSRLVLTLGLGGFRKTPSESMYPWNQNTWQTVPQKWLSRWI